MPGEWSGRSLDRVMADADSAGLALIQATAPVATAAAMAAGGCAVIAIAGYPVPAVIVATGAAACGVLAVMTARHTGRASQVRAALRAELVTAVEAWPEMASLGAAGQLAARTTRQLNAFGNLLAGRATAMARTAGAARAVTAAVVTLTVAIAAGRGAGAPVLVFLSLTSVGVTANAGQLIPAAEAGVLARQAARRLVSGDGGQAPAPSPGPAFRALFNGRELTVDAYRLPRGWPGTSGSG
jgi:ATP-binding cassette subfamily C protein CydC